MRKKVRLANKWIRRRHNKHFYRILDYFGVSLEEYSKDFRLLMNKQLKERLMYEKKELTIKQLAEKYNFGDGIVNEMYRKKKQKQKPRPEIKPSVKVRSVSKKIDHFLRRYGSDNS